MKCLVLIALKGTYIAVLELLVFTRVAGVMAKRTARMEATSELAVSMSFCKNGGGAGLDFI